MRTASNPTRGYLPWQLSVTFDYNISLHVYILTFILTHQQYCVISGSFSSPCSIFFLLLFRCCHLFKYCNLSASPHLHQMTTCFGVRQSSVLKDITLLVSPHGIHALSTTQYPVVLFSQCGSQTGKMLRTCWTLEEPQASQTCRTFYNIQINIFESVP